MSEFCEHGNRLDNLADKFGTVCPYCALAALRAQVIELEGEAMGRSQDDGKLEREIERLQAQVSELQRSQDTRDAAIAGSAERPAASPSSAPADSGLVDQTNLKDCDCAPAWDCRCDEISCPYCGPRLSAAASDSPPDAGGTLTAAAYTEWKFSAIWDENGELELEWYKDRHNVVVITLVPGGNITFSALVNSKPLSGSCRSADSASALPGRDDEGAGGDRNGAV